MTLEAEYTCPDGTPFPVTWHDAEVETYVGRWDQVHPPTPRPPAARGWDTTAGAVTSPPSPTLSLAATERRRSSGRCASAPATTAGRRSISSRGPR